jgi:hypothetical protein
MGQEWMRVGREWSGQLKISILLGMEAKTQRMNAVLFSGVGKPQARAIASRHAHKGPKHCRERAQENAAHSFPGEKA